MKTEDYRLDEDVFTLYVNVRQPVMRVNHISKVAKIDI